MLFKFLTGTELGPLQTGLILSQLGGFVLVFTALFFMFPSESIIVTDEAPLIIFLIAGLIKIAAPILVGKGIKIVFWIVVGLSVLKLIESVLASIDPNPMFVWIIVTGVIEIGALIHLLNPKARAELNG